MRVYDTTPTQRISVRDIQPGMHLVDGKTANAVVAVSVGACQRDKTHVRMEGDKGYTGCYDHAAVVEIVKR